MQCSLETQLTNLRLTYFIKHSLMFSLRNNLIFLHSWFAGQITLIWAFHPVVLLCLWIEIIRDPLKCGINWEGRNWYRIFITKAKCEREIFFWRKEHLSKQFYGQLERFWKNTWLDRMMKYTGTNSGKKQH